MLQSIKSAFSNHFSKGEPKCIGTLRPKRSVLTTFYRKTTNFSRKAYSKGKIKQNRQVTPTEICLLTLVDYWNNAKIY